MSDDLEIIAPRPRRSRRPRAVPNDSAPVDRLLFPRELPLLPIRDNVYFPSLIFPLFVGREKSVRALEEALETHRHIVLVSQREVDVEDPEPGDLYTIGTVAEVLQVLKVPDGTMRVMLEGITRFRITRFIHTEPYYRVRGTVIKEPVGSDLEQEALMRSCIAQFENIVNNGHNIPPEAILNVMNIEEPGKLADHIGWHLPGVRCEIKQKLLETFDSRERLEMLGKLLTKEVEILEVQRNIRSRVEKEMGENQREFILREQLKAIQQELGERDDKIAEFDEYRQKIDEAQMPETVRERALKELSRLEKMPMAAPDGAIARAYLDWLTSLPWSVASTDVLDIEAAASILDADHYGLPKVKDRILEFLAIRKLTGALKGPILCFVGPPGVGKTSIGRSIAKAIGRKFIRISLGGVRDEAEIRGHRRTYIGALPGRIIQGLKQAGTRNPVFMLDEIDKLASDARGDPSSALLEALDPEQNFEFSDHYIEAAFDLSDVMFITTANLLDTIPPPLRDRMEIISFSSYTEDEKTEIAKRFLVPKKLKEHGLTEENLQFHESGIRRVVQGYTREAGVRNLERELATICRKVARKVAEGRGEKIELDENSLIDYLGKRRFHSGLMEEQDQIGAATGLVYTEFGGDVISIEVSLLRGKDGRLTLTGQLGDVMKESAQAAFSYIRSKARYLDLPDDFYERNEIHIHVPAGAVPKDGPSAGITIATALASALTKRAVRRDVAMTGEITLRGRVLPIGGLKEKMLAAHRAGIRTIIMPSENEGDLDDIPQIVRDDLEIVLVSHMDEVLPKALLPKVEEQQAE